MFREIFIDLLKEKKITITELSKLTGISQPLLSHWKSGRQTPNYENLKILSTFFNVSIDYLFTGKTDTTMKYVDNNYVTSLKRIDTICESIKKEVVDFEEQDSKLLVDALTYASDYLLISDYLDTDGKKTAAKDVYNMYKELAICLNCVIEIQNTNKNDYKAMLSCKEKVQSHFDLFESNFKSILNLHIKSMNFDFTV